MHSARKPRRHPKTSAREQRQPLPASFDEVVARVREDARREASQYLQETRVPGGGE